MIKNGKKVFYSFFAFVLMLAIMIPSVSANTPSSSDEDFAHLELVNLEEVDGEELNGEEIEAAPFAGPSKPHFEHFGGISGLTQMGSSRAASFVKANGYKDAHDYKYSYLGKNTSISKYNIYYVKGSGQVYILDSSNRGVKTYEFLAPW